MERTSNSLPASISSLCTLDTFIITKSLTREAKMPLKSEIVHWVIHRVFPLAQLLRAAEAVLWRAQSERWSLCAGLVMRRLLLLWAALCGGKAYCCWAVTTCGGGFFWSFLGVRRPPAVGSHESRSRRSHHALRSQLGSGARSHVSELNERKRQRPHLC